VSALFPAVDRGGDGPALVFPDATLTYGETRELALRLAGELDGVRRAAIWAEPGIHTCVAVVSAFYAGAVAVPINPKLGPRELDNIVGDSAPDAVLCAPDAELPNALAGVRRVPVELDPAGQAAAPAAPADDDAAALILYTSGTTGLPKGVVLSRQAIAANVDALSDAWAWSAGDSVVQALPLFHAHGLVLGVLGTLRLGGTVRHVGRFSPDAIRHALRDGGTMLFAVPTMYHRLGDAAEEDAGLAEALAGARVLVSGSAALPAREHNRIERLTGHRIVERYGLSETLMVCAVRHNGDRRAGYVGPPLGGVEVRLLDDDGGVVSERDDETMGEVAVRGPSLFSGYLNSPDATAEVMRDGWFSTGDIAAIAPDGYVRIVGRRSTDLIKTGGYRVGAGEVEGALLEHESVAEAAVLGLPDDDLGERIVAWVVASEGATVEEKLLIDHVAGLLTAHKRPREIRVLDALPRNALGKVQKKELVGDQPVKGVRP
jgi:malonyl-CoA/methylmalonyl-CoA synthetase